MSKFIYIKTYQHIGCSKDKAPYEQSMYIRKEHIDYITPYKYESDTYNMCSFLHVPTDRVWHCEIDHEELIYLLNVDLPFK